MFQAPPPVGLENSEMWRAAARNLRLSSPQTKALCQLRQLFMRKHEALLLQRRQAMQALQQAMPSPASSHDMAQQFLNVGLPFHAELLGLASFQMCAAQGQIPA